MKTQTLVPCSSQKWSEGLPALAASHRLKAEWAKDRMKWLDSEGVPLEPDWSKCNGGKHLEDQCDLDALVCCDEVKQIQDADGNDDLQGPEFDVGGHRHEVIQILLPFEDVDEGLGKDFRNAAYL